MIENPSALTAGDTALTAGDTAPHAPRRKSMLKTTLIDSIFANHCCTFCYWAASYLACMPIFRTARCRLTNSLWFRRARSST
jgi:hypothetical protein